VHGGVPTSSQGHPDAPKGVEVVLERGGVTALARRLAQLSSWRLEVPQDFEPMLDLPETLAPTTLSLRGPSTPPADAGLRQPHRCSSVASFVAEGDESGVMKPLFRTTLSQR